MRIVLFFLYSSFHLLCGGTSLHAPTTQARTTDANFANLSLNNCQFNLPNLNRQSILIEYADLGLDDEYSSGDDSNDGKSDPKFFNGKYNLLHTLYSTNSQLLFLNYFHKSSKIDSFFSAYATPIYLLQGVLRI